MIYFKLIVNGNMTINLDFLTPDWGGPGSDDCLVRVNNSDCQIGEQIDARILICTNNSRAEPVFSNIGGHRGPLVNASEANMKQCVLSGNKFQGCHWKAVECWPFCCWLLSISTAEKLYRFSTEHRPHPSSMQPPRCGNDAAGFTWLNQR